MSDNNLPKEQVEAQGAVEQKDPHEFVEVETSPDAMKLFVKFIKPPKEQNFTPTKELVMECIEKAQVVYGINEELVEKLVARPIYNIKIQVGEADPPKDGVDGFVDFYVVRDNEYKPEIDMDENIDFKNLAYFQMVTKGQMLAAIHAPEQGANGKDLFGNELPGKDGKEAKSPEGKNTELNEDGTMLYSSCDGIVNFQGDKININDAMHLAGNVDNKTGNINFSGDVIVEGDVAEGYEVVAGGSIIIKGVVESCKIEAGGDVQIVKGVNGGEGSYIKVGGDLRSPYIEHAKVDVVGDITAESIIESEVTCEGDIDISNSGKGVLVGGNVNIKGNLVVKTLGNDNERVTNIRVVGVETGIQDEITSLAVEKETALKNIEKLKSARRKIFDPMADEDSPVGMQIKQIDTQVNMLLDNVDELSKKITELKDKWSYEYNGSIVCKGKMFYGTRIYFGEERYQFTTESLDHCRIYWEEGNIINVNL
jgi:uncharacterized protein (DUF342 family)